MQSKNKKTKDGQMSNWRKTSTKFHDALKRAMLHNGGKEMQTSQIMEIIEGTPELAAHAQFVYPSDHCINHTNKGACNCARTEEALFERVRRGVYRVRNLD